mgnify:CR=1 FL=1
MNGRDARFLTINPPPPHEGVGRALSLAYRPEREKMPVEFAELMEQLDQI